tara:strand:+ start:1642 stop:1857 length:216 start_codon:yes stop_codon:yes gene_type:complete
MRELARGLERAVDEQRLEVGEVEVVVFAEGLLLVVQSDLGNLQFWIKDSRTMLTGQRDRVLKMMAGVPGRL